MNYTQALNEISAAIGAERVQTDKSTLHSINLNTLGTRGNLRGRIRPGSNDDIRIILSICNRHSTPLYPISQGNNWGYGCRTAPGQDALLLDLSGMNRILDFNSVLGYVTVEPGVTQAQLSEYLDLAGSDFMVPTTGAGPRGSILGNAIERGFGITPIADHSQSLIAIKAVLANGEIYHSPLWELGGHAVDPVFKWKIGPGLEGLFAQSNFGIVTQGTIQLERRPEQVAQFLVGVSDINFEEAVTKVRIIKQKVQSAIGGINLMNRRRILSMILGDSFQWPLNHPIHPSHVQRLGRKHQIPDWTITAGVYGTDDMVSSALSVIKREFSPIGQRLLVITPQRIKFLKTASHVMPLQAVKRLIDSVAESLSILQGKPSTIALRLSYLKSSAGPDLSRELRPDQDQCGLMWFAPLVPMNPMIARDFVQDMTRVCLYHNIDPLITLTSISSQCFDTTLPLLFDQKSATGRDNAQKCLKELFAVAKGHGLHPYRLDSENMVDLFTAQQGPALRLIDSIKNYLDPNHIIAPGRYCSPPGQKSKA